MPCNFLYYVAHTRTCRKIPLASFQVSVILNGYFEIPFGTLLFPDTDRNSNAMYNFYDTRFPVLKMSFSLYCTAFEYWLLYCLIKNEVCIMCDIIIRNIININETK